MEIRQLVKISKVNLDSHDCIRNTNPPNIKELIAIMKLIVVHLNEHYDKIVHRTGITCVTWLYGYETRNMNFDFIFFSMGLRKYYPFLIRSNLLVGMRKLKATILKGMISIYQKTMKGVHHNEIKFLNVEKLGDLIDRELIPVEMGRPRFSKIKVPGNIKPWKYLDHFNVSDKNKEIFYDYHL